LSEALLGFDGALVLVSHDRHLLRTVADGFLLVDGGSVTPFDGDLEDYRALRLGGAAAVAPGEASAGPSRRDQRRREAERRERLRPLRQALEAAEARLEALQRERDTLEAELADGRLYDEDRKDRLKALLREQGDNRAALEEAEEAWLEAGEALEALSRDTVGPG
jgi:ATP-binding cassette subfamily F protein 3